MKTKSKRSNKAGSNLLTPKDDDQIELEELDKNIEQTCKPSTSQKGDPRATDRLIEENTDHLEEKTTKKKDLVVHFKEKNMFRQLLDRMALSKSKGCGIVLALVVSVLITFGITKYATRPEPTNCTRSRDLHPIEHAPENATILDKVYRLPTNIIPINYDLKIRPYMNPDEFYFTGSVLILVSCKNSTKTIQLNANELEIDDKKITVCTNKENSTKSEIKVSKFGFENEVITLELNQYLTEDENYFIYIPFKGNLTTSLSGFYRSSYKDPETQETRYLAMTQFQATDARRAFPCWDEPAFKATFDIEIAHWQSMTAFSNMPIMSHEGMDDPIWIKTKFSKTVKMSTYLVAFAVGDFKFLEDKDLKPRYRVITRPSEINTAKEALKYGPEILSYYEKYFKIKFPLPKIDMLAAPDFSAGAMENFGLIIYRETALLFNPKIGSVLQKYRICTVIAHELAHQWFGNLVTPIFWSDLWLNEGFATYMSYEGVNSVKKSWKVWDGFVSDEIHNVFSLDSLKNSHPISQEVNDPNEISELFDHISYSKGASIIRMLTYIIGKETFKEGLHNYLNAFKYSNADQSDLWRHLQEANDNSKNPSKDVNVKQIMDSWTLKEGFPLITITRNYETNEVRFSQQRFLLNSKEEDKEMLIKTQYEVPITYTTASELNWKPETKLWLHKKNDSESFVIQNLNISSEDWLIANLKQTGYYRVTYDEKNWNLLINQLLTNHTQIHRINRGQILNDLFHLAENGIVKYKLALRALEYFKVEQEPLAWISMGQLTYLINRMLRRTEHYGKWQNFVRKLIEPAFKRYELNKIDDDDKLQEFQMQTTITNIACVYELDICVEKSKKLFKQFMERTRIDAKSENLIPSNLRSTVYCTAIHFGRESEWNFLFRLYQKEQNANEKLAMLTALTCSRIPWILTRYLKWLFDDTSGIKTQDSVFVFKSIAAQNYGKDIAFNFLRENWEKIYAIHGKQMSFAHIVKTLDSINSEFELNLVKQFYRSIGNRVGSAKRAFLQTIEQIEANVLWMEKHEKEIADYIKDFENNPFETS